MANQANLEDMPAEKLSALEAEYKETDEANKLLAAEVKSLGAGALRPAPSVRVPRPIKGGIAGLLIIALGYCGPELAKLKNTPTDSELAAEIDRVSTSVRCMHSGVVLDMVSKKERRWA